MNRYIFLVIVLALSASTIIEASSHKKPTDVLASPCVGSRFMITRAYQDANLKSLANCPFNRSQVITFARKGFDLNNDTFITPDEIDKIKHHYLSAAEITALDLIETTATIMHRCDCDGDGKISQWDFEHTPNTCLRNCPSLTKINYCVGDRIADGKVMGAVKAPTPIDDEFLRDDGIPTA